MSLLLEDKLFRTENGEPAVLDRRDLETTLAADSSIDELLFRAARAALLRTLGSGVYLRGIVEISNACRKNCLYCGLRSGNTALERYAMSFDEIVMALEDGWRAGLRSFLLQSGELLGGEHVSLIARVLEWTRRQWGDSVRMVLSTGELPRDALERLHRAGGDRYLLRIETSDPGLYTKLHPDDGLHSFQTRLQCLQDLREAGWQTGSGVLIGVPGQTPRHLAADLVFLRDFGIDMCGMGPWIEHADTPLFESRDEAPPRESRVGLTLRMIALLRILMPDINISATTALQTLSPRGLEAGLNAGANVFMPNLTPLAYRRKYSLYEGKTAVADSIPEVLARMTARCAAVGRHVAPGLVGDPPHFTAGRPRPAQHAAERLAGGDDGPSIG